jgi:S1-C subfamily serine protease
MSTLYNRMSTLYNHMSASYNHMSASYNHMSTPYKPMSTPYNHMSRAYKPMSGADKRMYGADKPMYGAHKRISGAPGAIFGTHGAISRVRSHISSPSFTFSALRFILSLRYSGFWGIGGAGAAWLSAGGRAALPGGRRERRGTALSFIEAESLFLYTCSMSISVSLKRLFAALLGTALFLSCTTGGSSRDPSGRETGLSAKTLRLVKDAVFEVVLEKPQADQVVYERELDWDQVPYSIRTDKYLSIGTAFAISKTELLTAFHVINPGYQSIAYSRYRIRDSGGNVFEVDSVTGGSSERDFIVFTVKGKTFSDFFTFERNFKIGDPVYSIGNALGEGIVIRNGLVLGTTPEEESGRWNLLKSSADGNPGNSGGPLVTPEGEVLALVTSLRDNILYSVPSDVILDYGRAKLEYRIKPNYGHLILANTRIQAFETSVPLPAGYQSIRSQLTAAYKKEYQEAMTKLFAEAPEYLTGPNNRYLLGASLSSVFPELDFVDTNDDNWKLSNLERKTYNLAGDGRLMNAQISDFGIYKITRPRTVSLEKICTDPRYIMDLVLENIRMERTLWGTDKYRILSFGEPAAQGSYVDSLGRKWITAQWVIGFNDEVLIMFILPLPNGPALITTIQESSQLDIYSWDIRKICDHTHVVYSADFGGWNEFLALAEFVPAFLKDIHYEWDGRKISFASDDVSLSAGRDVFEWADTSELFLAPSWYTVNNTLTFGVRKYTINRDVRGKEFTVLYKNIKPDERFGTSAAENWNDLMEEKYPFDGRPAISVKDNTGSVGAVLRAENPQEDVRYTLYLSMEDPRDEENLSRRFDALRKGITVRK